ncbi:MAG TPA: hypothetical protein DCP51_00345 [Clostridiales bacterium]|nr:hypothetical protein [Clostridiales bacterium]HCT84726.1 hypothetical protein [Candidatus Margulisiibacteriota bacterium]
MDDQAIAHIAKLNNDDLIEIENAYEKLDKLTKKIICGIIDVIGFEISNTHYGQADGKTTEYFDSFGEKNDKFCTYFEESAGHFISLKTQEMFLSTAFEAILPTLGKIKLVPCIDYDNNEEYPKGCTANRKQYRITFYGRVSNFRKIKEILTTSRDNAVNNKTYTNLILLSKQNDKYSLTYNENLNDIYSVHYYLLTFLKDNQRQTTKKIEQLFKNDKNAPTVSNPQIRNAKNKINHIIPDLLNSQGKAGYALNSNYKIVFE